MGGTITPQEKKFFRPKKREEKNGEKFHAILKKAIRIAFQLLLLSFFFFISHQVYVHLLEDSFFRVREVEVVGCQRIPHETLLSLAKIEGMPNLFTVKLKEVAKRVESHPWIDQVKVRKIFPHKLLVQVEERKPIAILQLEELYYIDAKGVIFSPVGDRDEYNYPFLTGLSRGALEKDPAETKLLIMKALELIQVADKEKGFPLEEISEVRMEKTFGIHYFTKADGVEVRMGWEQFGEKLKRLSLILLDLQKRGFSPALIDCSDLKRMVVKKIPQKFD